MTDANPIGAWVSLPSETKPQPPPRSSPTKLHRVSGNFTAYSKYFENNRKKLLDLSVTTSRLRRRFTNWSPDVDGAAAGYRFSDPALPSFDIPEAVPNSPGDVLLTTSNSVVTKTGATTETYCNGDSAEYSGEDGYWYNEARKHPIEGPSP